MPAAIEAHDAGADVLIIEKLAEGGGSLRRSGGGIQGVNTVVQKALGVVDLGPDDLYGFMVAAGQGLTNPALLRVVADNCGPNVDWLIEDLGGVMPYEVDVPEIPTAEATPGLRYSHNSAEQFGYALIPRAHFMTPATERWMGGMDCPTMPGYGGGTGLFKPFDDAIKARAIRTMTETALIELVATPDREVLGVKALSQGKTLYIKAKKGVFLATSGMTNNEQMIRTYVPSRIGRTTAVHALMSHGEGIIAGHAIGADLYGMANPGTGTDAAGGLAINPKAQVIDVFGNVIPRLYAGGMVVGGLYYDIDWQGGSHVACAVCFGRIGGRNAAQEEPWA
jgi:succinate dehydrogenase/fumarate reductase flavoprotein subunit